VGLQRVGDCHANQETYRHEIPRRMTRSPDWDRRDVLLGSTGLLTELLEELSGEPIDAERILHESVAIGPDGPIDVDEGHALLHRAALLRGRVTRTPYLYAESLIDCERLPEAVCAQLQHTNTPLGRALVAQGLEFRRAILGGPRRHPMSSDEQLLDLIRSADTTRSYRILIDDAAVIAVDEWFLPAALHTSVPPTKP
jgi:chorismate-pyruvate lyase